MLSPRYARIEQNGDSVTLFHISLAGCDLWIFDRHVSNASHGSHTAVRQMFHVSRKFTILSFPSNMHFRDMSDPYTFDRTVQGRHCHVRVPMISKEIVLPELRCVLGSTRITTPLMPHRNVASTAQTGNRHDFRTPVHESGSNAG